MSALIGKYIDIDDLNSLCLGIGISRFNDGCEKQLGHYHPKLDEVYSAANVRPTGSKRGV